MEPNKNKEEIQKDKNSKENAKENNKKKEESNSNSNVNKSSQEPGRNIEDAESFFEGEGSKEFIEYCEEKLKTIKICEASTKERNEDPDTNVINQNINLKKEVLIHKKKTKKKLDVIKKQKIEKLLIKINKQIKQIKKIKLYLEDFELFNKQKMPPIFSNANIPFFELPNKNNLFSTENIQNILLFTNIYPDKGICKNFDNDDEDNGDKISQKGLKNITQISSNKPRKRRIRKCMNVDSI